MNLSRLLFYRRCSSLVSVLLPTQELAMQVHEQYEQLRTKAMPKDALIIGGVSEKAQIQSLRTGCGLVIATAGRIQDLMIRASSKTHCHRAR